MKKHRPNKNPQKRPPTERRGLDDILGSADKKPLSISAITSKPATSEKSEAQESLALATPSEMEYQTIPQLMTSINQHLNTMARMIAFAKHTEKGTKDLPPHLEELCAGEGEADISAAVLRKAGWADMEKLLHALSEGVHLINRGEDTPEIRRKKIAIPAADFFVNAICIPQV